MSLDRMGRGNADAGCRRSGWEVRMSFNLATLLRESARTAPDKPLLHFGDQSLTYAQVDETSGRVASALLARGLDPGRTVAVQLPNLPQFVLAYFGILKAGLVMLPLNPLLKAPETPTTCAIGRRGDHHGRPRRRGGPQSLVDEELRGRRRSTSSRRPPPTRRMARVPSRELYQAPDHRDIAPTNADDTAVLLYTSGTPGKPKGAELTHFQLFMACTVGGDTFGYRPERRVAGGPTAVPRLRALQHLQRGRAVSAAPPSVPRFETGAVLDALERHAARSSAASRRCTSRRGPRRAGRAGT
jgi:long-chain acyl-CoA synthetase